MSSKTAEFFRPFGFDQKNGSCFGGWVKRWMILAYFSHNLSSTYYTKQWMRMMMGICFVSDMVYNVTSCFLDYILLCLQFKMVGCRTGHRVVNAKNG